MARRRSYWVGDKQHFVNSSGSIIQTLDFTNGLTIIPGAVRFIRTRFTAAQVDAGASLLAALGAGLAYKMVDCAAIAIGGAAGAVTTVDIIGTVSTARKLVAFGQAALTENTLVRAGSSGGVILAAGASYTVNDANTAITIGNTGSDLTTATHIDIHFTYVIEAV